MHEDFSGSLPNLAFHRSDIYPCFLFVHCIRVSFLLWFACIFAQTPLQGIYVRKRRSAQNVKWRAVVKLQAMARAKAASLRASKLAQNRAMQAALLIGTMLRARAKLRRKKQRRDELVLKTTVYLQAWVRARRWRKELRLMKLAQKWFAHVWRQFFDRKYLRPLVALQRWARAAVYGKHARCVQTYVLRPWLARQRAQRQRREVDRVEAIRRAEEDAYVGQAVLVAVGAICDGHAGKGAFQGVMVRVLTREMKRAFAKEYEEEILVLKG